MCTCEVSLIPSTQVGKRKMGRKERQVDKLGLSRVDHPIVGIPLVGLQRARAAKFAQSVAWVLHVAEKSNEVSLFCFLN